MPSKKKLGENEMPKEKKDKKTGKYKILPVRPAEDFGKIDRELPKPLQSMFKKNGAVMQIFAAPGSGKSNFISSLVLQENLLGNDFFQGGLYFISPTAHNDLTSRFLVEQADFVETDFSEALVEEIFKNIMMVPKEDREYCCLIFDDCMGMIKQNSFCCKMASTCRHMKSLQIYSTQSVKSLPPNLRSNMSHTVIFYTASNKQLNDIIELHAAFGGEKVFYEKYMEATGIKYGFLLCDFRDMILYKWGADRDEPIPIWSKYDDDGNINTGNSENKKDENSDVELNKGLIK